MHEPDDFTGGWPKIADSDFREKPYLLADRYLDEKKEAVMNLNIVKGRMAVDKLRRIRITALEECVSIDLVTHEGIITILGYGEDKPNHIPVYVE